MIGNGYDVTVPRCVPGYGRGSHSLRLVVTSSEYGRRFARLRGYSIGCAPGQTAQTTVQSRVVQSASSGT